MNKDINIYCASGWFTEATDSILTKLESILIETPGIKPYLPRHDGVKLSANEFHDHNLRKKIFEDNVSHISSSDFVLVNLDGSDGFYDTGTMWELGYAMANQIPVIIFDTTDTCDDRFISIKNGFHKKFKDFEELKNYLHNLSGEIRDMNNIIPSKVLFIGPDSTEEQVEVNKDIIASVIMECHGSSFRWLDDLNNPEIYNSIDDIFKDIDYIISVIDDRHPIVAWVMGQAYKRNIPVISYTNFDYGVNIMLLVSILRHVKGKDELRKVMQKLKREGIYSLPEYDSTNIKAM